MAAATTAEVKARLANLLKIAEGNLPSYWDGICAQAAAFASQECTGRLLRRGFSPANVSGWDRLNEFSLDLALWKAAALGGAYADFGRDLMAALDRRKELDEVLVFVSGVWVRPPMGEAGTVVTAGPRSGDAEGVWNWQPDEDPTHYGIVW